MSPRCSKSSRKVSDMIISLVPKFKCYHQDEFIPKLNQQITLYCTMTWTTIATLNYKKIAASPQLMTTMESDSSEVVLK